MNEPTQLQPKTKILIVEYDPEVAQDIERGLKEAGYEVVAKPDNGNDAIHDADEMLPDLALIDIHITGETDGIKAADQMWKRFKIPSIFLTDYSDNETLKRAKGVESFGYITKRFQDQDLQTAIEIALQKHRSIQKKQKLSEQVLKSSEQHLKVSEDNLKNSEDNLKNSEENFRLLVNSITDYAIFMLDPEGKVVTWNTGAEHFIGYRQDEILGQHFSIFYSKDDVESGLPGYVLQAAEVTGRCEIEKWLVRRDDTKFWANGVITPLFDDDRNLTGFANVTRDLTERKKSEDLLRMSNELLEKRVSDRTSQLRDTIQTRDEFLSVVSHELKTPLTTLTLTLQMLLRDISRLISPDENSNDPMVKIIKMIKDSNLQSKKLNQLLEELLDLTRIRVGKFTLHKEIVDISSIAEEVVKRKIEEARKVGSSITLKTEGSVNGEWDSIRVEQVIGNLLSNAIKYGAGNSIEVYINEDTERDVAILAVRDNGIGIPSDMLEKIFDRFDRISEEQRVAGLGLGLYIVRKIVDAHRGTIRVESTLAKGTTFTVEFPTGIDKTAYQSGKVTMPPRPNDDYLN